MIQGIEVRGNISFLQTPGALARSYASNRFLILGIFRTEVLSRYRNTLLGMLWALINPLVMLMVYAFVFGHIFKVRFPDQGADSTYGYGIVLFSGLILHVLFAETLGRAQGVVLENRSYVKRVIFPLEVLPVIVLLTSLFHAFVSLLVLVAVMVAGGHLPPVTVLLLPVVWLPFLMLTLGLALFFASLGVFLRDLGQILGFVMTILLFASPILFPVALMPEFAKPWIALNPLTVPVEQTREVLLWGRMPDWAALARYAAVGVAALWAGGFWFVRSRKGFADVL
jgi:lipopolysaccharide transport system permease protein